MRVSGVVCVNHAGRKFATDSLFDPSIATCKTRGNVEGSFASTRCDADLRRGVGGSRGDGIRDIRVL
jgi:hypothetical protein